MSHAHSSSAYMSARISKVACLPLLLFALALLAISAADVIRLPSELVGHDPRACPNATRFLEHCVCRLDHHCVDLKRGRGSFGGASLSSCVTNSSIAVLDFAGHRLVHHTYPLTCKTCSCEPPSFKPDNPAAALSQPALTAKACLQQVSQDESWRCRPLMLGLGQSKMATSSLAAFVTSCGVPAKHYNPQMVYSPAYNHSLHMSHVASLAREYSFINDNPIPLLFRELGDVFPRARFLLHTRHNVTWFPSLMAHFQRMGDSPQQTQMRLWAHNGTGPEDEDTIKLNAAQRIGDMRRNIHPSRLLYTNLIENCMPPGLLELEVATFLDLPAHRCSLLPHANVHLLHNDTQDALVCP